MGVFKDDVFEPAGDWETGTDGLLSMDVVESAALRLEPVVVRRAKDGARCEGILDQVSGASGHRNLIIAPIHARGLGAGPVRVFAPELGWVLCAQRSFTLDATRIAIPLDADSWLTRVPPRSRRARTTESRPLVFAAGKAFGDHHAVPVIDVSRSVVAVQSPVGVAVGSIFDRCEVLGDLGVIRQGQAEVVGCTPWFGLLGDPSFHIRFQFSDAEAAKAEHDLIRDRKEVGRLLDLAQLSQVSVRSDVGPLRLLALRDDWVELHRSGDLPPPHLLSPALNISFDLFNVTYSARVRVISQNNHGLRASLPLFLRRFRRRTGTRSEVPSASGFAFEFIHPATGETIVLPVLDLSASGAALGLPPTVPIWPEMPLDECRLLTPEPIPLGRTRAKGVGTTKFGVEFGAEGARDSRLQRLASALRYPHLTVRDEVDFDAVYELYERTNLLAPFMAAQVEEHREEIKENWSRLHRSQHLCQTFINEEDGQITASATALQAWDGTWVAQHMAAQRGPRKDATGTVFQAVGESLLGRPDFRFVVFFTSSGNDKIIGMHSGFQAATGTPDIFARTRFECWRVPSKMKRFAPAPIRPISTEMIARAATREVGSLTAASLGWTTQGMDMPQVSRHFASAGLFRERTVMGVGNGPAPIVSIVDERCSKGVNLTGMMNACWLLPTRYESTEDLSSGVRGALNYLSEHPGRMVMTTERIDSKTLEDAGMEHLTSAYYYAMNRAGLTRYSRFVSDVFGELNLRKQTERNATE